MDLISEEVVAGGTITYELWRTHLDPHKFGGMVEVFDMENDRLVKREHYDDFFGAGKEYYGALKVASSNDGSAQPVAPAPVSDCSPAPEPNVCKIEGYRFENEICCGCGASGSWCCVWWCGGRISRNECGDRRREASRSERLRTQRCAVEDVHGEP